MNQWDSGCVYVMGVYMCLGDQNDLCTVQYNTVLRLLELRMGITDCENFLLFQEFVTF